MIPWLLFLHLTGCTLVTTATCEDDLCPDGYLCKYGVCQTNCWEDDECQLDLYCTSDGECREFCNTYADCAGFRCLSSGRCDDFCIDKSDCTRGYQCNDDYECVLSR